MKKLIILFLFILITSCASTNWQHTSGVNSNISYDKNYCRSKANVHSPTYICKDPLMCKPEEFSTAITALADNAASYRYCMFNKGYNNE
jgi:hypothetical protein